MWSKYQEAIFDFLKNESGNLFVEAVAGSGKTTTIIEAMNRILGSCLAVSFNKHIADEMSSRVPPNVTCSTLNGFGWRVCIKAFKPKLERYKTHLVADSYFPFEKARRYRWVAAKLVGLMKANLEKDWRVIARNYEIEIPDDKMFVSFMDEGILDYLTANVYEMDFDDQVYMPVAHNLALPEFDYIFVDEAQDLNPVQIELLRRMKGRYIFVGDRRQSIYAFRGADTAAVEKIITTFDCKLLPLSICYRCPRSVVELAQREVPNIEWAENAQEGIVDHISVSEYENIVRDGDKVLCRMTAPLISACIALLKRKRKAFVKGRDVGQRLSTLARQLAKPDDNLGFFKTRLEEWSTIEKEKAGDNEEKILNIEDTCEAFLALFDGPTVQSLLTNIEQVFQEEGAGIELMTVHRSKGLECPRIFILAPEKLPHPSAKSPEQKQQEKNLWYVGVTRAKHSLFFVRSNNGTK